jgi:nicotinate-nucleotide pyrophosphorylase (carboxylating)
MTGFPEGAAREAVARALAEDLGPGDVTTLATVPAGGRSRARIIAREAGIIAGLPAAQMVFETLDAEAAFRADHRDGDRVSAGETVAGIEALTAAILSGERTALNFLQRMSGIATQTARYVAAVSGAKAKILDTRKTAPGLRALDKWAVRAGGGQNHRFGLYDGVLIKDNHLRAAGGVAAAVAAARAGAAGRPIEVEVENLTQLDAALAAGADVVLLDNMDLERLAAAVARVAGRARTEVSGGVTLETVRAIAELGVDFISIGALTHSVRALDIALELE